MGEPKNNTSRRKVLKKAGVVGGVAAAAAWTKPSLNAVVLPAHAQMSVTSVTLGGGTASSLVTAVDNGGVNNIANRVLDALVPTASAGTVVTATRCGFFTVNGPDDYTHCVEIELDSAQENSDFTFRLTGPDIYYNMQCYFDSSAVYYYGVRNLSGSTRGTLSGRDLTVYLGDFEFSGTISDDFESATGVIIDDSGDYTGVGNYDVGSQASCGPGYSAYWSVTSGTRGCVVGAGIYNSGRVVVVGPGLCPV